MRRFDSEKEGNYMGQIMIEKYVDTPTLTRDGKDALTDHRSQGGSNRTVEPPS